MSSRRSRPPPRLHLALLAKFEDCIDSANASYYRLPAIPNKHGLLPGQTRPKKVLVHLPQLDPIRFPLLYNPETNGLALDPTVKHARRRTAVAQDDDNDAEKTVSEKLAAALRANSARVLDLFRQMDENDDGEISRAEFMKAFQEENNLMEGLDVPTSACGALFDEWDTDRSGTISFAELRKTLSKKRPLQPRRWRGCTQFDPRGCAARQHAATHAGESKFDDRRGGQPLSQI